MNNVGNNSYTRIIVTLIKLITTNDLDYYSDLHCFTFC